MKIAESAVVATEAALASLQARIAADAANYASPPADGAELSLEAGAAERRHALLAAQLAALQADLKLAQAKRNMKAGDMATEKAAKDAEAAQANAAKALEAAQKAAAEPTENYTRLTAVHPATSTGRRLALARWITSRDNPLPARVAINHLWLRHFGSPLVPSTFDFGINGKPPTNQPLLDWLAVELMESGWKMKHVHKLMVMSRTYRLRSNAELGMRNAESMGGSRAPYAKARHAPDALSSIPHSAFGIPHCQRILSPSAPRKTTMLTIPLAVKNAASSRDRSPGFTS